MFSFTVQIKILKKNSNVRHYYNLSVCKNIAMLHCELHTKLTY